MKVLLNLNVLKGRSCAWDIPSPNLLRDKFSNHATTLLDHYFNVAWGLYKNFVQRSAVAGRQLSLNYAKLTIEYPHTELWLAELYISFVEQRTKR